MNNEFLKPRENRWKWFNYFGFMRRWVYIERSGKCKNSAKKNIVNRFSKYVNRLGHQKYKPETYEDWSDSVQKWIDSSEPKMKNDAIELFMNWFSVSHKDFMMRFKIWWIDSIMIRFKFWSIVSFKVRKFKWYDSRHDESIQQVKNEIWLIFK